MNIPQRVINKRFEDYFGEDKEITDRNTAINVLKGIVEKIQKRMVHRIETEDTYAMLLKLHYIFDEVHSLYLKEKEARTQLVKQNIDETELLDEFIKNSQIERNIIDMHLFVLGEHYFNFSVPHIKIDSVDLCIRRKIFFLKRLALSRAACQSKATHYKT